MVSKNKSKKSKSSSIRDFLMLDFSVSGVGCSHVKDTNLSDIRFLKTKKLERRFLSHVERSWFCKNTYDKNYKEIGNFSSVYLFVCLNINTNKKNIVYIGSTLNLLSRYKSHNVPSLINAADCLSTLYFLPLEKGFYDYEVKLIRKLRPILNRNIYAQER